MEPMLSGTGDVSTQTPSYIAQQALSNREKPTCNLPTDNEEGTFHVETEGNEFTWKLGFSKAPANVSSYETESNEAHCHARMEIDTTKFDCTSKPGWCQGRRYLSRDTSGSPGYSNEAIHAEHEVPSDVKAVLDAKTYVSQRINDGRFLGPPGAKERPCFECPGPAPQDNKLYCVRTVEGTWIGFRWYCV